MSDDDDQMARSIAKGIDQEKSAEGAGNAAGVVVFLAVAALVIYLGIQFNWGGWAGLWALVAGGIAGAMASDRMKKSVLNRS